MSKFNNNWIRASIITIGIFLIMATFGYLATLNIYVLPAVLFLITTLTVMGIIKQTLDLYTIEKEIAVISEENIELRRKIVERVIGVKNEPTT